MAILRSPRTSQLTRIAAAIVLMLAGASTHAAAPPNIVYIISDDQSWTDYGFMGNKRVHTPHLDALARQSARFVNGYVPTSVCRPSLATLLTGLFPHQHGIHFNHGPPGNSGYNRMTSRTEYEQTREREFDLIRRLPTLPGLLASEAGYRSLQTGKFWEGHWRNGGFTAGMTTFEPPPIDQTFGGARTLAGGQRVAHGNGDAGLQIGRVTMAPIFQFIDDCETAGVPWMVWYAPFLPHQPHDSPDEFYELAKSHPDVAEHELPYFASIAQFDATVGELVQYVEDRGLADDTLFVFVADNGWRASENRERSRPEEFAHTKNSKRAPFDDGLRTPILLRWDNVIEPATHTGLVSSIDLMPTILAAAGVNPPDSTELPGVNLLPFTRGKHVLDTDRALFGEIYPGDASSLDHPERDIAYRWVRQQDLKLIVPHVQAPHEKPWGDYLDSVALYNVTADPFESTNLANSPALSDDVVRLQDLLNNWWTPAPPKTR